MSKRRKREMDSASILASPRERADQDRRWDEVQKWPDWRKNGAVSEPFGMNLNRDAIGRVVDCLSDAKAKQE